MKVLVKFFLLLFILLCQPGSVFSVEPVSSSNGMVVTQHYLATQAGVEVLKEGGNAVDAAVTVGFVLAVTLPEAGNIGGGGFMLVHMADTGETIAIDYRERAPASAYRDMFLDDAGEHDTVKSQHSHLSVGVPGTVAGLSLALEKYGTISLERALRPAIELAENGFELDGYVSGSIRRARKRMEISPESLAIFFRPDGSPYAAGDTLVQTDLAWSLKQLRDNGPEAFYKGEIAHKIVSDMAAHGGMITIEDLAAYTPVIRTPVYGVYRGYEIFSMPPPSSGGIHVVQMLNILEGFPKGLYGPGTAKTLNLMAECMKLAFADRSKYLGDSDFVIVPVEGLTSKIYAEELRSKINLQTATPGDSIRPGLPPGWESDQTTHFSVMDRYGNAVSNTYTLNFSYGSGITAAGTGILLNNEMDDFSAKPGAPNADGLIGGVFNEIMPYKRMLSSMTPTIVMKDGRPFIVTGSPGSSRIINSTLQVIVNVIDHGMNIAEATNFPRIHHQWKPDRLRIENNFDQAVKDRLTSMGHTLEPVNSIGVTQSAMRAGDMFHGASDPRGGSSLAAGW